MDNDFLCQDLLVLANKYNLKLLVKNILPEIISNLDVDNCIEAYAFGIVYKYENLKMSAFSIIAFNWKMLQDDKEMKLKILSKDHPKEYDTLMKEMKNLGSPKSDMIDFNNCIDAYVFGLKFAAFEIIRENSDKIQTKQFESRLEKMSENYPNEYKTLKRKVDQLTYLRIKHRSLDKRTIEIGTIKESKKSHAQKDIKLIKELRTYELSPELFDIVGKSPATVYECKEKLFTYISFHQLRDPRLHSGVQYFIPDNKLAKIFGCNPLELLETILGSGLAKTHSPHLFEIVHENESPNWLKLKRPVKLSKDLADIIGVKEASHIECVRKVWSYVKEHNLLQEPQYGGASILPDSKLDKVLSCERDIVTGYAIWDTCKIIM